MATLAKVLEKARKKAGISIYRVAKKSGVHDPSVYRMFSGEQKSLTLPTAKKLAKALGNVTPGQLLGIE